jgi:hypothetical protein
MWVVDLLIVPLRNIDVVMARTPMQNLASSPKKRRAAPFIIIQTPGLPTIHRSLSFSS